METPELAELATFEARIIGLCAEHKDKHWRDIGYRACVSIDSEYFVKYGSPTDLGPEFMTQSYIYDYAILQGNGPRIPKVPHYFLDKGRAFLVMEYIELEDTSLITDLPERAAAALDWLSRVPAPSEDMMGPIGGGLIRHRFFKDREAPLCFSSIKALESYMNEVRRCLCYFRYPPSDNV